jgi:protoporphyrinogen oxidase
MNEENSRRDFLRQLAGLLLVGGSSSLARACAATPTQSGAGMKSEPVPAKSKRSAGGASASGRYNYKISQWTGDNFTLGHRLREKDMPNAPIDADKSYEFIIVGGGIAGLAAAYYLRDHNLLLLEQYGDLGGQSRGGIYRGLRYSHGAAYMGTVEGIYGDLFADLGIKPVTITARKNGWYWQSKWYQDVAGPEKCTLYKEFAQLLDQSKPIWKTLPEDPTPDAVNTPAMNKLDSIRFIEVLKGYSPAFLSLLDKFVASSYCGGLDQVSALAGYLLMTDLVTNSYVFEGGNSAISRALAAKIDATGNERLVRDAFVWEVSVSDDQASVIYSTKDGAMHRARAGHVIVTAPPLVAGRFMNGIDDKLKAYLLQMKFGSYLVANCLLSKQLFTGTYDNWVGKPFSFADITIAETPYVMNNTYNKGMGSVLTLYQPYPQGSPGRALLMIGNRQEFASSLVSQLAKLVQHLSTNLEEVVLTRWGHAMAVPEPGYFQRLRKIHAAEGNGVFSLAHSSMQGLPSAEAAITAARIAADRALSKPPKVSSVFSRLR